MHCSLDLPPRINLHILKLFPNIKYSSFYFYFYWVCFVRSIGDESLCKEVFEEYIAQLKEEAKENERKRKEERV